MSNPRGTSWWWGKGQEKYSQQRWPLGSTGNRSKELSSIQFPWLAGSSGRGGWVHSCGAVVHVAGQDEGHLCNLGSSHPEDQLLNVAFPRALVWNGSDHKHEVISAATEGHHRRVGIGDVQLHSVVVQDADSILIHSNPHQSALLGRQLCRLSSKELSTKEGPFPGHRQVDADALRRGAALQCRPLRGQLICQVPGLDRQRDRVPSFCRSSEVSPTLQPSPQ